MQNKFYDSISFVQAALLLFSCFYSFKEIFIQLFSREGMLPIHYSGSIFCLIHAWLSCSLCCLLINAGIVIVCHHKIKMVFEFGKKSSQYHPSHCFKLFKHQNLRNENEEVDDFCCQAVWRKFQNSAAASSGDQGWLLPGWKVWFAPSSCRAFKNSLFKMGVWILCYKNGRKFLSSATFFFFEWQNPQVVQVNLG